MHKIRLKGHIIHHHKIRDVMKHDHDQDVCKGVSDVGVEGERDVDTDAEIVFYVVD